MSIGSALVLIALGVLFYLRPKVFFITMKVCGVLVVVGALGFGAWYGYGKYKESHPKSWLSSFRPNSKQTQLEGIALGARKVDVTVALGKPTTEDDNGRRLTWQKDTKTVIVQFYDLSGLSKAQLEQVLAAKEIDKRYELYESFNPPPKVSLICVIDSNNPIYSDEELFDLHLGSSEKDMIDKVGQETEISVSDDGLRKSVSYPDLQVAFELSERKITKLCVSTHAVKYIKEYDEKAEAQAKLEKKQAEETAAAEEAERLKRQAELEANARAKKLREAEEARANEGFDDRLRTGKTTPADLEEVKKMAGRFCAKKNDDRYTTTNGYFYNQCVESRVRDILAGNL
jgi:hypothetical protein